jgi:hypothetical protein
MSAIFVVARRRVGMKNMYGCDKGMKLLRYICIFHCNPYSVSAGKCKNRRPI